MPTINQMLEDVKRKEGGYVDHPNDRGGATHYGITRRTLSLYRRRMVSKEEVRNLSWAEAKEIYTANYYRAPRIDRLPKAIQPKMFDMCINHGARNAIKMLQRVINQAGVAHLAEDGICGVHTQKAAREAYKRMGDYMVNALVDMRMQFYRRLVKRRPSQKVFMKGWTRRAESFRIRNAA